MTNFSAQELLPTKANLLRQEHDRPGSLGTYEQWLVDLPDGEYPDGPAYNMYDADQFWTGDEAGLLQTMKDREISHAVLVSDRATITYEQELIATLATHGTIDTVVCPGTEIDYVYLPDDLGNMGYREVWEVNRAGPIVMIVSFDPGKTSVAESSDILPLSLCSADAPPTNSME